MFVEVLSVFGIVFFLLSVKADENSVFSYFFKAVDPDTYLTTPEIIRRHGYPADTHIIESEDGYLLGYHRVPHGKSNTTRRNPYPVLLFHGVLSCSADWIINGPERSLAYKLADEGYDVWLGNARGTTESKAHVSMNPAQREFWNYTFHEMGKYDIPAAINYILNVTNCEKLIYIGHSQGTTMFYVFATTRPELSDKVLVHISLAPTANIPHTTTLFRYFVPIAKEIQSTGDWYRRGPFLEYNSMLALMGKFFCDYIFIYQNLCEKLLIFRITGRDDAQFHQDLFSIMMSKFPAGTSAKNMIHSSTLISPGKFTQFDYGVEKNIKIYNQTSPPEYDLSQMTIPMRFYYGNNDLIANPIDTRLLYHKVPKPIGCIQIPYEKWNHVDFLWAKDVNQLFNEELLQFMKNATESGDFIERSIAKAIEERKKGPVPIDISFDEEAFNKSRFKGSSDESKVLMFMQQMLDNTIWL